MIYRDIINDDLAYSTYEKKYAASQAEKNNINLMYYRVADEIVRKDQERYKSLSWWKLYKAKKKVSDKRILKPLEFEEVFKAIQNFGFIIPQGSVLSNLGVEDKIGSLSNCFVIGQPEDSYGGILQKDEELVQLMKRRGGVGLDLSTLRPNGTTVTNSAGSSTGLPSFMHRYSNSTREVAQDGRRGALMLTCDVRHPDVFEFVNMKQDRTKVTGANISVMLRDEFMEAVQNDENYILRFPCEEEVYNIEAMVLPYNELVEHNGIFLKKIKARELFHQIVHNAWENAEPGCMFIDTHHEYSPESIYPQYKGITTNPCGEILMQAYDACRLIALNLLNFVQFPFTEDARLDRKLLYKYAYLQQRIADIIVDLEIEYIDRIIDKINYDPESTEAKRTEWNLWHKIRKVAASGRRTGCGLTALGDMLAALNLKYDSSLQTEEAVKTVMYNKSRAEIDCSTDLAILFGAFEGWDAKLEEENVYKGYFGSAVYSPKAQYVSFESMISIERMIKYGRRNVSMSTVAPTGTISLLAGVTSGIEPLFLPYYIRRRKINPSDKDARVDFTDQNGDSWQEFPVLHPTFKYWCQKYLDKLPEEDSRAELDINNSSKEDLEFLFTQSPWYGSCANDLNYNDRLFIQHLVQRYTTHSISSTINLPKETTEREIADIYLKAFHLNLKGVTVYRDGCRTGVLISDNQQQESSFEYAEAYKRPKTIDADYYSVMSQGKRYDVFIGLIDDKPYEVFARENDSSLSNTTVRGSLTKVKKGIYKFDSEDFVVENVISNMTDMEETATRLISSNLRTRHNVKFLVEQLNKSNGDLTSFGKVIARTLKRYIPNGEKSTVSCSECGSQNVIFEEGCQKCLDCGNSKCS